MGSNSSKTAEVRLNFNYFNCWASWQATSALMQLFRIMTRALMKFHAKNHSKEKKRKRRIEEENRHTNDNTQPFTSAISSSSQSPPASPALQLLESLYKAHLGAKKCNSARVHGQGGTMQELEGMILRVFPLCEGQLPRLQSSSSTVTASSSSSFLDNEVGHCLKACEAFFNSKTRNTAAASSFAKGKKTVLVNQGSGGGAVEAPKKMDNASAKTQGVEVPGDGSTSLSVGNHAPKKKRVEEKKRAEADGTGQVPNKEENVVNEEELGGVSV